MTGTDGLAAVERGERLLSEALVGLAGPDRDAFTRFYDLTAHHLLGIVLEASPGGPATGDALLTVYLELWRRAPAYDPAADAGLWILEVVRDALDDRPQEAGPAGSRMSRGG